MSICMSVKSDEYFQSENIIVFAKDDNMQIDKCIMKYIEKYHIIK